MGKQIKAERVRPAADRAVGLCAAYGQETAQASPQATANAGLCGCPRKAFPPLAKKEGRCAAAGCRAGQRRRGRGAFHWGAKATSTSFEPESNQRPKDDHTCRIYSPPLYQLSYRRVRATKRPGTLLFLEMPQHHTETPEVRPSELVGSPFEETGVLAARAPSAGARTRQSCGVAAARPLCRPASGQRVSRCLVFSPPSLFLQVGTAA